MLRKVLPSTVFELSVAISGEQVSVAHRIALSSGCAATKGLPVLASCPGVVVEKPGPFTISDAASSA